jgi:hypothetical protein
MKHVIILLLSTLFISSCVAAPAVTSNLIPAATFTADSVSTSSPTSSLAPTPSASIQLEPIGSVSIDSSDVAFDVNGDGRNVDSIAFWEAEGPEQSLMFVTSKDNDSIEVYQYPFHAQLETLSCGGETNGVWVDQERDILYVTKRDTRDVCAFDLPDMDDNPSLRFSTSAAGSDSEPNLTMLTLPGGQKRIYVSYDDTVYYHDTETAQPLGQFTTSEGLETMYGDDYYQVLYIPDEGGRSGVYIYDADGNPGGPAFGDRSIFDSDAEGIWLYKCLLDGGSDTGEGLIVVADQKDEITDFEVFARRTKEHLGKINISGVNNTDGISITQQASPAYPLGLLAVIDDDTSTVGVGWDVIFAKAGLSCGT